MAMYDNQHWLLSHIRDSFISTDETGMCEMVMVGEDIPEILKSNGTLNSYPGMEESDEEDLDAMAESYDISFDMEFSHRQRSNTAQRLEKMDIERQNASKVKHVKWEYNPVNLENEKQQELFQRKDFRRKENKNKRHSLLSEQLDKGPKLPQNPFTHFARFDGNAQIGIPVRKYRIFMCMFPKEKRPYPLQVVVVATAKVQEFIGLICYKFAIEHPNQTLHKEISQYGLYILEDDEVDLDFPCLDPQETISKFHFNTLGLVKMKPSDRDRHNTVSTVVAKDEEEVKKEKEQDVVAEDLAKMEGHTTAMEAPLFQLYRVNIIHKLLTKSVIQLGISGEKIEIDSEIAEKATVRFWTRPRAASYHIDRIAWCELAENKGSKTMFSLVYNTNSSNNDGLIVPSNNPVQQPATFKTLDFETDSATAEEIVRKINHILELRSSSSRKEYLEQRERKAASGKSVHQHR